MRKLLVGLAVLTVAGAAALPGPAAARGGVKTYICWTSVGGYTDCAWLPRGYHIPGVKRASCRRVPHTDRVELVLTRRIIRALARQGVRTDTMAPGHWADLQAVCKGRR